MADWPSVHAGLAEHGTAHSCWRMRVPFLTGQCIAAAALLLPCPQSCSCRYATTHQIHAWHLAQELLEPYLLCSHHCLCTTRSNHAGSAEAVPAPDKANAEGAAAARSMTITQSCCQAAPWMAADLSHGEVGLILGFLLIEVSLEMRVLCLQAQTGVDQLLCSGARHRSADATTGMQAGSRWPGAARHHSHPQPCRS